jgi:hypothetical protein
MASRTAISRVTAILAAGEHKGWARLKERDYARSTDKSPTSTDKQNFCGHFRCASAATVGNPAILLLILGFVAPTAGSTLPHKSSRKQLHGDVVIPCSRVDRYVISTCVLRAMGTRPPPQPAKPDRRANSHKTIYPTQCFAQCA